jgi:hypothetical protein
MSEFWKSISAILGVAAFLWVALQSVRHRLVWLWRPAFIASQFRLNAAGGLDIWLIFRNPRAESDYVTWVALVAEFPPTWVNEHVNWKRATLSMDAADDPVLIVPTGDSVRRVRLRLGLLEDQELPAPPANLEAKICRQIITFGPAITIRLQTSEGWVVLNGYANWDPLAVEAPSFRRRVLRLLP